MVIVLLIIVGMIFYPFLLCVLLWLIEKWEQSDTSVVLTHDAEKIDAGEDDNTPTEQAVGLSSNPSNTPPHTLLTPPADAGFGDVLAKPPTGVHSRKAVISHEILLNEGSYGW